jgi:ketosteroid isomerase-like protein
MEATDELRKGELARRVEDYRTAYQARDVGGMLALFADDAELTAAPGTFRGKAAIRKFLEWDARVSPAAAIHDTGLGVLVVGRSVVWERQVLETAEGVPFREDAVTILEFDDAGLIRRYRSYYDKLRVLDQITSGMSGVYGWFANKLVGYLVALGKKGLDTSSA